MRRALTMALVALAACSKPSSKSTPTTSAGAASAEDLDVPAPEPATPLSSATGPLTPFIADSAPWRGRGPPPSSYSIFGIPQGSPVLVYGAMTRDGCEAELRKRGIAFKRVDELPGVRAPVHLLGPLHGVTFHSRAPHTEVDCRLVLALDDFSVALAQHDIVGANVFSSYRTPKENGCTNKYAGEQHCAAMAVDVGVFEKKDRSTLNVEKDFHGKIGTLTCRGNAGPKPATDAAKELWALACNAAGRQFQVILTPNWNEQHKNHFHLELTTHDWVLIR